MSPDVEPVPDLTHVLLVEDEIHVRNGLAEKLREAGLHVIEAANADEAWAYLQTGAPVDLMFSDVRMPGSMDGAELARKVAADYPRIRVALTSGHTPAVPGGFAFLAKPYGLSRAAKFVMDLLGKQQNGASA